jgi:hypothetical protein
MRRSSSWGSTPPAGNSPEATGTLPQLEHPASAVQQDAPPQYSRPLVKSSSSPALREQASDDYEDVATPPPVQHPGINIRQASTIMDPYEVPGLSPTSSFPEYGVLSHIDEDDSPPASPPPSPETSVPLSAPTGSHLPSIDLPDSLSPPNPGPPYTYVPYRALVIQRTDSQKNQQVQQQQQQQEPPGFLGIGASAQHLPSPRTCSYQLPSHRQAAHRHHCSVPGWENWSQYPLPTQNEYALRPPLFHTVSTFSADGSVMTTGGGPARAPRNRQESLALAAAAAAQAAVAPTTPGESPVVQPRTPGATEAGGPAGRFGKRATTGVNVASPATDGREGVAQPGGGLESTGHTATAQSGTAVQDAHTAWQSSATVVGTAAGGSPSAGGDAMESARAAAASQLLARMQELHAGDADH